MAAPDRSHDPLHTTPTGLTCTRFRLFPVRSPLLRESLLLYFPGATEMCQFTPFTDPVLCIQTGTTPITRRRVFPSEISGSSACVRLTGAYRSLPRPSLPPSAKASTEHPSSLDHTHPTAEHNRSGTSFEHGGQRHLTCQRRSARRTGHGSEQSPRPYTGWPKPTVQNQRDAFPATTLAHGPRI